jgi:hypothetical protein
MRFEGFTTVTILMKFFWVWAPCGLAGSSQHFGQLLKVRCNCATIDVKHTWILYLSFCELCFDHCVS